MKKFPINYYFMVYLIWLLVFTGSFRILAAQSPVEMELPEQHYVSRVWDNTKGLPVNTVFTTVIDKTGYLWAATEEGLVRFDGLNFKIFNQDNIPGISSPLFYDVILSEEGDIWAANIHALVHLKDGRFTVFDVRNEVGGSWINTIAEGDRGEIWLGTHDGNLLKLSDDWILPVDQWRQARSGIIEVLHKTSEGILIGTQTGLHLFRSDSNTFESIKNFEKTAVRALASHPDGSLWIGTEEEGVFMLKNEEIISFDNKTGLKNNQVNSIFVDKAGKVWIGMSKEGVQVVDNLNLISPAGTQFVYDEIRHIQVTANGTVWLAPMGSGLIQMIPADVRMITTGNGLSNNVILPIFEDEEGVIWVGTAGSGLSRIEGKQITHITPREGLTHGVVLGIYSGEDYTYIGTARGLNRYDKKLKKVDRVFTKEDGLSDDMIYGIYKDTQNRLWATGASGGIYQLIDHERLLSFPVPDTYLQAEFINIFEDREGNLWFGSYATGALKLDENGQFTEYPIHTQAPSGMVSSFYEDDEGDIWMGTHDGLLLLKNESFRLFTRANGLQFNGAHSIIADGLGYIWLSSNYGIQRIFLQDLLSLKNDTSAFPKIPARLFDTSDGMANNEANGGIFPAGWKLKNGEIWFPTIQGIATIDPRKISSKTPSLKVHIGPVRYGDQEFNTAEKIKIPAGVYNMEIQYGSLDFRKPHTINYSYRLNNITKEWSSAGNRHTAYFTSLLPGEYTFEVKAEQFGVESEISSIRFSVAPFFHQTIWFKILILLSLFLSGFFIRKFYAKHLLEKEMKKQIREQTQELKNRNQLLENALNDIAHQNKILKEVAWVQSHRLRGPLSTILGLISVMKNYDHFTKIKKSKQQLLQEIEKASIEMDGFIRQLNRKIENIDDKKDER